MTTVTEQPVVRSREHRTVAVQVALGRHPRTGEAVLVGAGLVAAGLLVWQLGSGDVITALAGADLAWTGLVVITSLVPFVGAAVALAAFTPRRVDHADALAVQVATGFVAVVTPPSVGQVAVNARYLHGVGLSAPLVAGVLGVNGVASVVVTLVLVVLALATTGAGAGAVLVHPAVLAVAVALVVVLGMVVALVPRLRARVVALATQWVSEVGPYLREVAHQPGRLLVGVVGELLVTAGYVAALAASLAAFGVHLPLAQTAVVLLVGGAVGSVAPTPAGLGAVEAALVAGLVATGVPAAPALSAVLVYRLVTVWLRVPLGWFALRALRRRGVL